MSMRDHYRTKAAEFHARARVERDEVIRRYYKNLAEQYSRLADGDAWPDLIHEPPPLKILK